MDSDDLAGIADAVLEREDKDRKALRVLLGNLRRQEGHHLALSSRMGGSRSYVTSVSLEWIAKRLRYASQLPIFKQKIDADGRIVVDAETIDMVQQRNPDYSRQWPMTLYLAARKSHKFPPILAVVTQAWADNPDSDNWNSNKRATKDSCVVMPLDDDGYYVDLRLSENDFLYAIDGQHRLMGIEGLAKLLSTGKIFKRSKVGKELPQSFAIEDIVNELDNSITHADLQKLMSERIGIEIIPAVMKNETQEEARRRLRSIFVHVNRHAKPLAKGELDLLTEDDGFAIVARSVMVTHPLLKDRTDKTASQLSEKSPAFTTLRTLVVISTNYLGEKQGYSTWKAQMSSTGLSIRPDEAALDQGIADLTHYCDSLARIPSYADVINGADVANYRSRKEAGKAHLLFLPIGQQALARAIGKLTSATNAIELSAIAEMLRKKDAEGVFNIVDARHPWWGVIYNPIKKNINNKEAAGSLCARLLTHVLGRGTTDGAERESLTKEFREARITDPDNGKARDLQNNEVVVDQVSLPSPWWT